MSRYFLIAAGALAALTVSVSTVSAAPGPVTVKVGPTKVGGGIGKVTTATTYTGFVNYTSGEALTFKFDVASPLTYDFTETFMGTFITTPTTFTIDTEGDSGKTTLTFPGIPYLNGTVDYTLTTTTPAVPEPASWALMVIGAGVVGAGLRRRGSAGTMAVKAA